MKKNLFLLLVSFLFMGLIHAQGNHFTPIDNPNASDNPMEFWAEVFIDEEQQTSENIEVGMFVNDICRATARVHFENNLYLLQIYAGIEQQGSVVTFKLYDHQNETELDDCSYSYTITEDGSEPTFHGFPDWIHMNFTTPTPVGPEYPWVPVDPQGGANTAWLIGVLQVNGVAITESDNWAVGAFSGDVCRGISDGETGWYINTNPNRPYSLYIMMELFGNNNEELTFKLYDKQTETIYAEVDNVTVTYVNDEIFGSYKNPVILNFEVPQTFIIDVDPYTTAGGYYLIATPVGEVSPENVENMLSNEYDLYYFDQNSSLEWINYKPGEGSTDPGFNLIPGKGYLYANSGDVDLIFTGIPYNGDGKVVLDKDVTNHPNSEFEGWNLVGNPFAQTAYIDRDFYVMNGDGSEIEAAERDSINAMEGIFVIAEEDGEEMYFTKEAPGKSEKIIVNVMQNRGNVVDRAIIRIGEGRTLPKFMLHENSTKLYISQNNEEFAVVRSINDNDIPVNFRANQSGVYTLSVSQEEVNMPYMHLIDNLTGADIDLLATPNYQFNAEVGDLESRFIISFKGNSVNVNENASPINYFQNGRLTVNNIQGEAELEVIDLFGRVLSNTKFNGTYNEIINATPGVYMIRLTTADNTYTQKIVVE